MRIDPRAAVALPMLALTVHASATRDAARGAQTFRVCTPCHSTTAGVQMTGPSLANVWGHEAASVPGAFRGEFKLRLKTDLSDAGPRAGKPVIIGAGMQGDRASVVFASPAEISRFIRETCP
jgi:hypothetical protein